MKKLLVALILILCFGCTTTKVANQATPPAQGHDIEDKYGKMLAEGQNKLVSRYTREAIENYFNPVIEAYNLHYGSSGKRVYCSRGTAETLFYLLKATDTNEETIVISQLWADAFYLKGYASLDLGRIEDAETFVKKAVELSYLNSMYLSELGHIYQVQRKWSDAAELYEQAEQAAEGFSPEHLKNNELTRAMRGRGYILIELGKLDEAGEIYRKCLEIDENDKMALNELKYIESIRNKSKP